jgi:zinc transporter 2
MMAGGSPSDEIAAKVDEEGDMAKPLMDSQESSGALDDSFASASASDFPRGALGGLKKAKDGEEETNLVKRKLLLALSLSFTFMMIELVGGALANSLAIMTDAAHMLSDSTSFFISFMAVVIAARSPDKTFTYGYQRFEIVGALASVMIIWILTLFLIQQAISRTHDIISGTNETVIDGKMMTIIALIALVVNSVLMFVLGHHHHHGGHEHGGCSHHHDHSSHHHHDHSSHHHHDHSSHHHHDHSSHHHSEATDEETGGHRHQQQEGVAKDAGQRAMENINIRAAYIHALGDLVQSIGVCIAGILIWIRPEWQIADPICTFVFCILVLYTTIQILNQSISVIMEKVPSNVDLEGLSRDIEALPGVVEIHDVHVWSIKSGVIYCTAHIVIDVHTMKEGCDILEQASKTCASHNIDHACIQIEKPNNCPTNICY